MTTYTVAVEGEETVSKDTKDLDQALDWFTNAVEEVMDPEGAVDSATLAVDGEVWGRIGDPSGPEGGEVVPLRPRRKPRAAA